MKLKSLAALLVAGLITGACLFEGISAGAVLGFVASHAGQAGEAASVIKNAIERYKASETRRDKIKVLAEVSCLIRKEFPEELDHLRLKAREAGVPALIMDQAKALADEKCGNNVDAS